MEQILKLIDASVWNVSNVMIGCCTILRLLYGTCEEFVQLPSLVLVMNITLIDSFCSVHKAVVTWNNNS
jgi:hypothetical protein